MYQRIRHHERLELPTGSDPGEILRDISGLLVTHGDHSSLFDAVGAAFRRLVHFDCASLALLDHSRENLSVRALSGRESLKRNFPLRGSLKARGSHLEQVLTEGRPVIRRDLRREPLMPFERRLKELGLRSYVSVPLLRRNSPFGSINIGSCSCGQYANNQLPFLENIASQLAIAVDNISVRGELASLRKQLAFDHKSVDTQIGEASCRDEILGASSAIQRVLQHVAKAAPTDVNIVLTGETGTGKDLVAHAIHRRSRRSDRPLVVINCASVPRELFESEFFGHVKGAFTGALRDRIGGFELARSGTLFLDEVTEIPYELQGKLLRVLQDGKFERVGDVHTRSVDVRIIAATNRNLEAEVCAGRFRQDLFYRLHVYPIELPPLRERKEDIPLLAKYFVSRAANRYQRHQPPLTQDSLRQLVNYAWPGNLREMQAVIERAIIRWQAGPLRFEIPDASASLLQVQEDGDAPDIKILTEKEFRELEKSNILAALRQSRWRIYGSGGAADLLGLPPTTLASRMGRLGLRRSSCYRKKQI